jgi:lactobin A/cerein 7B family class IIb bacteriocin
MRELSQNEMNEVNGGFLPLIIAVPAAITSLGAAILSAIEYAKHLKLVDKVNALEKKNKK